MVRSSHNLRRRGSRVVGRDQGTRCVAAQASRGWTPVRYVRLTYETIEAWDAMLSTRWRAIARAMAHGRARRWLHSVHPVIRVVPSQSGGSRDSTANVR